MVWPVVEQPTKYDMCVRVFDNNGGFGITSISKHKWNKSKNRVKKWTPTTNARDALWLSSEKCTHFIGWPHKMPLLVHICLLNQYGFGCFSLLLVFFCVALRRFFRFVCFSASLFPNQNDSPLSKLLLICYILSISLCSSVACDSFCMLIHRYH